MVSERLKILMHFRHFPVAMGRFFHWAFQDLGYEVFTVGPYSNGRIPWGDFYYPEYKFPPDYILPEMDIPLKDVLEVIPFKPDVVIQASDACYLTGPSPIPNYFIGTDPHAIDYKERLQYADHFFCMQNCYKPEDATWIPYAYNKDIHKYLPKEEIQYDVVMSGLQYEHRVQALEVMQHFGLKVVNRLGLVYEEYVKTYNQGKIAFVWSSKQDLPARFWEGLAMRRLVLTNRVPDLEQLEFKEGVDYVGFTDRDDAVEKAVYYAKHETQRLKIAENGWKKVQPHTYQERCKQILEVINKL